MKHDYTLISEAFNASKDLDIDTRYDSIDEKK